MENEKHLRKVKEYMESFASAMELDDLNGFLNEVQNFYDDGYFEWMVEQAELLEEKEKERAKWKGRYTKEKNAHKRYKNDMKYKWRRFRAAENKIDALEYVLAKREQQNKRYREFLEDMYNHAYGLQLYPHVVDEIKKLLEETEDA